MYSCRYISEDGSEFDFSYDNGVIFDLTPLSELDVNISSSQGFQQLGETLMSRSVKGVTRTVKGKLLGDANIRKSGLLRAFAPFSSGRLYFNDLFYCDCCVKKTPVISAADKNPSFSLMLFCPYPYWKSTEESIYSMNVYSKAFSFPVTYGVKTAENGAHMFGVRQNTGYTNCRNTGNVPVYFSAEFTAEAAVTNYGLADIVTAKYMRVQDSLVLGDSVRFYRTGEKLYLEKTSGGTTQNIISLLDADSDLFFLETGDNLIKLTADSGRDSLSAVITFNNTYSGVYDGMQDL